MRVIYEDEGRGLLIYLRSGTIRVDDATAAVLQIQQQSRQNGRKKKRNTPRKG